MITVYQMALIVLKDLRIVPTLKEMMIVVPNLQLLMDLAKQVQSPLHLYLVHQESAMKHQILTQLTLNVKITTHHVKPMEEAVKLLYFVVIIRIKQHVHLTLDVYGQHHVKFHIQLVHL